MILAKLAIAALALHAPPVKEGYLQVPGGQVWYRLVGEGPKTPLIVLHGGPGVPHDYLGNLEPLAKDRPVLFYDQLGCGKSDRPDNDKLWTIERFCQELAAVREQLGLKKCILYGHSWGTILGVEAYLRGAKGIQAMILAGPALDVTAWQMDADRMVRQLPAKHRNAILSGNKTGKTESPAYQEALHAYYDLHLCRAKPAPQAMSDALAGMGFGPYLAMNGPNEFTTTGSLKGYCVQPRLGGIKVPTLYICGEFDEATPASTKMYQERTPGSKMVVLKGCSHLANLEKPELYLATLRGFLNGK